MRKLLTNIQQLRGIAAMIVVIAHVLNSVEKRVFGVDEFLIDGMIGVDIFFVISGFIMVGITHEKFGSGRSAAEYALRRIARIVPVYWVLTLLMAVLFAAAGKSSSVLQLTSSLFFYPLPAANGLVRPVLGQGWTLDLEMYFYAIFTVCLLLPRRQGLIALCAILCLLPLVGLIGLPSPLSFWCSPIVLEFLFGVLLGLAFSRWGQQPVAGHLWLIAAILTVMVLGYHGPMGGAMDQWRPLAWIAATAAVGVAAFFQQAEGQGRLSRYLICLGDWSYSLYLVHIIVLLVAAGVSDRLFGERITLALGIAYAVGVIVVSIFCAMLSHDWLERPLERALRRLLRTDRRPAVLNDGLISDVKA